MICFDFKAVVDRMRKRKVKRISWNLKDMQIVWEFVSVSQCRDYDGTIAGWSDRPNEEVLQQLVWKVGSEPRYSNYWNVKL